MSKLTLHQTPVSSVRRKRYPKTTVLAGSMEHPKGFSSLKDAYQWSNVYLTRIANKFGKDWLLRRLRSWRWTFSTAFSGLGAPESALCLVLGKKTPPCTAISLLNLEAVASLEAAAAQFLEKNVGRRPTHKKVLTEFTCEIDKHCQKVLEHTYQSCNFPDILNFDTAKKTQFCTVHRKLCVVQKNRRQTRTSTAF